MLVLCSSALVSGSASSLSFFFISFVPFYPASLYFEFPHIPSLTKRPPPSQSSSHVPPTLLYPAPSSFSVSPHPSSYSTTIPPHLSRPHDPHPHVECHLPVIISSLATPFLMGSWTMFWSRTCTSCLRNISHSHRLLRRHFSTWF